MVVGGVSSSIGDEDWTRAIKKLEALVSNPSGFHMLSSGRKLRNTLSTTFLAGICVTFPLLCPLVLGVEVRLVHTNDIRVAEVL